MRTIKQARVTDIQPAYLIKKDALKYTSMNKDTFRIAAEEFGLSVYARGPKKIWYKVTELNQMLESYKLPK